MPYAKGDFCVGVGRSSGPAQQQSWQRRETPGWKRTWRGGAQADALQGAPAAAALRELAACAPQSAETGIAEVADSLQMSLSPGV